MSRIIEVKFTDRRDKVVHITNLNFIPSFQRGDKVTLTHTNASTPDARPLAKLTEYIILKVHHKLFNWVAPHDEGLDYSLVIQVMPADERI
ncbi:hypothetical protein [Dyadobacter diqingensis]|uniref:hypothetical protein n=1 Tax=Dyadobacter diqingensis TaxID=2938121 RepID=UPI0020C58186|nr:hypothetical protein [Dyadobacter diqingensis]